MAHLAHDPFANDREQNTLTQQCGPVDRLDNHSASGHGSAQASYQASPSPTGQPGQPGGFVGYDTAAQAEYVPQYEVRPGGTHEASTQQWQEPAVFDQFATQQYPQGQEWPAQPDWAQQQYQGYDGYGAAPAWGAQHGHMVRPDVKPAPGGYLPGIDPRVYQHPGLPPPTNEFYAVVPSSYEFRLAPGRNSEGSRIKRRSGQLVRVLETRTNQDEITGRVLNWGMVRDDESERALWIELSFHGAMQVNYIPIWWVYMAIDYCKMNIHTGPTRASKYWPQVLPPRGQAVVCGAATIAGEAWVKLAPPYGGWVSEKYSMEGFVRFKPMGRAANQVKDMRCFDPNWHLDLSTVENVKGKRKKDGAGCKQS